MRTTLIGIFILCSLHIFAQADTPDERVFYKFSIWEGDYFGTPINYSDVTIITITDTALYMSFLTDYECQYMYSYYNEEDPVGMVNRYSKEFKPNDSVWVRHNPVFKFDYVSEKDTIKDVEYIHIIAVDTAYGKVPVNLSVEAYIMGDKLHWVVFKQMEGSKPRITSALICEALTQKQKQRWWRRKNKR